MKTITPGLNTLFTDVSINATRWLAILPLAGLVTLALLVLMERLIFLADAPVDVNPQPVFPEVYWEEPQPVVHINKKLQRPKDAPPAPAPLTPRDPRPGDSVQIRIPASPVTGTGVKTISFNLGNSLPVAQFMVQPRYPSGALRRGTEGYVDVMFDVTEIGTTANITVLAAVPEGVFENAAIEAVQRWKYQPKTVDDVPVMFEGLTNRIRFEMQK